MNPLLATWASLSASYLPIQGRSFLFQQTSYKEFDHLKHEVLGGKRWRLTVSPSGERHHGSWYTGHTFYCEEMMAAAILRVICNGQNWTLGPGSLCDKLDLQHPGKIFQEEEGKKVMAS